MQYFLIWKNNRYCKKEIDIRWQNYEYQNCIIVLEYVFDLLVKVLKYKIDHNDESGPVNLRVL